jgi:hypothetical protein
MKKKLKVIIVASLLFGASGFHAAKAITADELLAALQPVFAQIGQAFAAIGQILTDHESRISGLENANPNFGNYSMGFSPEGTLKNAVVLSRILGNGNTAYNVRSRYATSTEQININGVSTPRPFIGNYVFVETDPLGNVIYIENYIEAPDTENYIQFFVEQSTYDPISLAKTVFADNIREDWSLCSGGARVICIVEASLSLTGEPERTYSWSSFRSLSGPVTVNGMTFANVRLEEYAANNFTRVRAQGIGEVMRTNTNGDSTRKAIYYQANGVTGGSLAGTPFAPGQLLHNLFL